MSTLKDKDYVINNNAFKANGALEHDFLHWKSEIYLHGFLQILVNDKPYRVYNPFILTITQNAEVEVSHRGAGEPYEKYNGHIHRESKPEVINGEIFYEPYTEGYEAGVKYLEDQLRVTRDTILSDQWKTIVDELKIHYYGTDSKMGWIAWKTGIESELSYNKIMNFGYYAGLMAKVDEYASEFPIRFEGFHKLKNTFQPVAQVQNKRTGAKRGSYKGSEEKRRKLIEYYYELIDSGISHSEAKLKATTACKLSDQTFDSALDEFRRK